MNARKRQRPRQFQPWARLIQPCCTHRCSDCCALTCLTTAVTHFCDMIAIRHNRPTLGWGLTRFRDMIENCASLNGDSCALALQKSQPSPAPLRAIRFWVIPIGRSTRLALPERVSAPREQVKEQKVSRAFGGEFLGSSRKENDRRRFYPTAVKLLSSAAISAAGLKRPAAYSKALQSIPKTLFTLQLSLQIPQKTRDFMRKVASC